MHGLYLERYAFRDAMTNVVIQHLISDAKVHIFFHDKCHPKSIADCDPQRALNYFPAPTPQFLSRIMCPRLPCIGIQL